MKRTPRGFAVYGEFKDSYGNPVRVQKSSAMGRECVWVFCHRIDPATGQVVRAIDPRAPHGGLVSMDWPPHLTKAQAKRLIRALQKFVEEP